jgi:hypothetical protein
VEHCSPLVVWLWLHLSSINRIIHQPLPFAIRLVPYRSKNYIRLPFNDCRDVDDVLQLAMKHIDNLPANQTACQETGQRTIIFSVLLLVEPSGRLLLISSVKRLEMSLQAVLMLGLTI